MGAAPRLEGLADAVRTLKRSVLDAPASTPPELRRSAFEGSPADAALTAYAELVGRQPYRVTDAVLAALRESGFSDDEIFELTVAAALGAAQRRLDAAVGLLDRHGGS